MHALVGVVELNHLESGLLDGSNHLHHMRKDVYTRVSFMAFLIQDEGRWTCDVIYLLRGSEGGEAVADLDTFLYK